MEKQNETAHGHKDNDVEYPIPLHKGKILNVIQNVSDKYGVWYSISIVHENGDGRALRLIHNEFENWLKKVIDDRKDFPKEFYDMVIDNWDKIVNHLNDCIAWINAYAIEPKHKEGDSVKIVNYDGLEGRYDTVDRCCISPFVGYYYVLKTLSYYHESFTFIHFKESNLVPA